MRTLSFTARLTLWHGTAVVLILAATAGTADWWLSRSVERQIDAALVALAETEAASALDGGDDDEIRVHVHDATIEAGRPALQRLDKLVQIIDARGLVVARSATLGEAALPAPPELLARLRRGEVALETLADLGGEPVRLVSLPIDVGGDFRYAVQVATSLRPAHAFLRTARSLFLGAALAILAGILLTGWRLAVRALRPIDRIVAQARRIGDSTLGERLPVPRTEDELARLATTLNEMLERIERGFETQRRFTADASHELRSPLSRLRAEIEIALRRPRSPGDYEAVLRSGLDEVERLGRLTEDLLVLARLDAGEGTRAPRASSSLRRAVEEALDRLAATAAAREIGISRDLGEPNEVDVAPGLLALLVGNLLENAVKFSPPGGQVMVRTARNGSQARLDVTDTGPGIPPEELPRIFDRFYRGRAAGSPHTEGVGLGLAIARAVAEAHGGTIAAASQPGKGTTFTVRLPLGARPSS